MTTKFEQLLDYIVNEEHDKANELFHEIVVEKSRNIYENLIAQEATEEEKQEESMDSDEEKQEESMDSDEEDPDLEEGYEEESTDESYEEESADESLELEDAYALEGDDDAEPSGLEKGDDFGGDTGMPGEFGDDEEGGEPSEESAIDAVRDAIEELEAAFAELQTATGAAPDEFGDVSKDDKPEDEMMGMPTMEGKKRMTREYVEKVGNDWEKNSQKTQADYVGAKTGDVEGKPVEGKSPIANLAKPGPTGVSAKNLNQGATEGQSNTGTSPGKAVKGINPTSGEKFASGIHNVDGKKSGVKTLSNVKGGHGAEKKGAGPGPVGSGTGDKAGQTSVPSVKQFLKPYSK